MQRMNRRTNEEKNELTNEKTKQTNKRKEDFMDLGFFNERTKERAKIYVNDSPIKTVIKNVYEKKA